MDVIPPPQKSCLPCHLVAIFFAALALGVVCYLLRINRLLATTPAEIQRLTPTRWTRETVKETYRRLEKRPITPDSYKDQLSPRLDRRYIVTGGSGLVGGHIVLHLLARGQTPESIRILDFQKPHRRDMLTGPAANVDFVQADITSNSSTDRAFEKPWPPSVERLPLTVFHTAAVIVPSERLKPEYAFTEAVNVHGTQLVLSAARLAGADVFVYTSSGSISIRPVELWVPPYKLGSWPNHYAQRMDEADFFKPVRERHEFFANYPASKAVAERMVCAANGATLRTGAIRPCHGVYGHPTDNTVGGPLNMGVLPAWSYNIVQPFVHGINCAVAHLQMEAILAEPGSETAPQAGRPFAITDPNPPIQYQDLWFLIQALSITPFRTVPLQPILMLLVSYVVETYCLLRLRFPVLCRVLPTIQGDIRHLRPALFSVATHLYANNEAAAKPVIHGGLGYKGVITTLEGMCQEVLEWNLEHMRMSTGERKKYTSSVSLAEEIRKLGATAASMKD